MLCICLLSTELAGTKKWEQQRGDHYHKGEELRKEDTFVPNFVDWAFMWSISSGPDNPLGNPGTRR